MPEIGVTFASLGVLGPARAVDVARVAADAGHRSFWTAEANGPESFALLGAVAAGAPGLALGTGIVPLQVRSPALTAMGAATLQTLAPDVDVLVGVGVSSPVVAGDWHGAGDRLDRPLARVREYLTLLRELLSGEPVTFEGDFWSVRRFRLGVRLGDRRPRLVLAALNEGMLRLAGELADGVLLNYLPASHVGWSVDRVREGGPATVYAYVHAGVGDPERHRDAARRDLYGYAVAEGYARMFERAGYGDEMAAFRAARAERDREGGLAAISERMIDDIDHVDDEDGVAAFVHSYRDAGVDHPVLMPLPWGDDRWAVTEATIRAAARS